MFCDTYEMWNITLNCCILKLSFKGGSPTTMRQVSLKSGHMIMHISVWFHYQGVLLQVNTGITLPMTSWLNTDIHTNTVRTNFNHFPTLPQNLVLLWWILFEKYFFKHSNPISSVVSGIKSGVRGSYAAEKVGTLAVRGSRGGRGGVHVWVVWGRRG